jgi:hypothetical protein
MDWAWMVGARVCVMEDVMALEVRSGGMTYLGKGGEVSVES